nr:hypothetical protein [uncultured Flavobacterium sp.]
MDYAGYIDGGLKIKEKDYRGGSVSLLNNYIGIKISMSKGWLPGIAYSASYSLSENYLPKSEIYNRIIFGRKSNTYKSRSHYWTNSILLE